MHYIIERSGTATAGSPFFFQGGDISDQFKTISLETEEESVTVCRMVEGNGVFRSVSCQTFISVFVYYLIHFIDLCFYSQVDAEPDHEKAEGKNKREGKDPVYGKPAVQQIKAQVIQI